MTVIGTKVAALAVLAVRPGAVKRSLAMFSGAVFCAPVAMVVLMLLGQTPRAAH